MTTCRTAGAAKDLRVLRGVPSKALGQGFVHNAPHRWGRVFWSDKTYFEFVSLQRQPVFITAGLSNMVGN